MHYRMVSILRRFQNAPAQQLDRPAAPGSPLPLFEELPGVAVGIVYLLVEGPVCSRDLSGVEPRPPHNRKIVVFLGGHAYFSFAYVLLLDLKLVSAAHVPLLR